MNNHEFELQLSLKPEIIKKNILDFEYYPNFMKQIKEVKILEKSNSTISTQETLVFKSILTKEITQTTMHTIFDDRINSEITSGMAKGTKFQILLTEIENAVLPPGTASRPSVPAGATCTFLTSSTTNRSLIVCFTLGLLEYFAVKSMTYVPAIA